MIRQLRLIRNGPNEARPARAVRGLLMFTLCMAIVAGDAQTAYAQRDPVTIQGGRQQENRQVWRWTVTNRSQSPIVYMRFPHFRGDIFSYPKDRWNEEITNRNEVGMVPRNGTFILRAKDPSTGLQPGQPLEIGIQVAAKGAFSVLRDVEIRFADGTTVTVPDVDCPQEQPIWERNILLLGFGAMFLVLVIYRSLKGRRLKVESSQQPDARNL